jgi:hypothetical protein
MKRKVIKLIVVISVSLGCSKVENNIKTYEKFSNENYLDCKTINIPPVLYMIGEIELLDSVLITLDLKADKIFNAFKIPDFNHLGSYMQRGRGPDEEIIINPYFRHLEGNKFIYHNSISLKIAQLDLKSNRINIVKSYNLPGKLMNLQSPFILDKQIIGWNPIEESNQEFLSYDPISKKITTFGEENLKFTNRIPSSLNKLIYAKIVSIKPDKSKFAVVYDKFPILRIYNSGGELLQEMRYENAQIFPSALIKKKASQSEMNQITQNYRKIKSTNKFIYALYIGKKNNELNTPGVELDDFSNEIHVWDWKGNPINKILLDNNIFSFCVTPDDKYLIGSSLGSIDKLYKYKLKWGN